MAPVSKGWGRDIDMQETWYYDLNCKEELWLTHIKRQIMTNWGDSEVKEVLLRAEDEVNWRFSGMVTYLERDVDATQALKSNTCADSVQ